jgi:hypothetical protein
MTYSTKEPPEPVKMNGQPFDQFKLAEIYGGDLVKSSMGMSVLRVLLKTKMLGEGDLACRIGSRMFRPEWKPVIEILGNRGFVTFKPTGKGVARTVYITELAFDFLKDQKVEAEPDPVEEQPKE